MKQAPQAQDAAESEEDLAERFLASRDSQAFAALVRRTQDFAYRVAFGRCGNTLAEEVVQDTYLQLARPGCRFASEGPGSFKRWLCSVVTNVARKHLRKEVRAMKRARSREAQEALQAQALASREHGDSMNDETRAALKETLGGLEEDLRLPIVLYYFEGLSQDEVGHMVGVSQTLIARRLQQGLDLLRKRLGARGVTASAAALPVLLNRPELLSAPQTLRASLDAFDLTRLANLAAHSARASQVLPAASFPTAAVLVVTLAAAAGAGGWYLNSTGDVPVPTPANVAQPVDLATPADPGDERHSGSHFWNFDTGIGAEFNLPNKVPNRTPEFPLPAWNAKGGTGGTGALQFAAEGRGVLLPVSVPTGRSLPIRLTFDVMPLAPGFCWAGTAISVVGYPKPIPEAIEAQPKFTWQRDRWVRWERRIVLHDNGLTEAQQTYGKEDSGSFPPVKADWITEPGGEIRLRIFGRNILVDNVRLAYGDDALKDLDSAPLANGDFFWNFDDGLDESFVDVARQMASKGNPAQLPDLVKDEGRNRSGGIRFAPSGGVLTLPPLITTAEDLAIVILFDVMPLSERSSWRLTALTQRGVSRQVNREGQPTLKWQAMKWFTINMKLNQKMEKGSEDGAFRLQIHGTDVMVDNVRLAFGSGAERLHAFDTVSDTIWEFNEGLDKDFQSAIRRPAAWPDFPQPQYQAGQGVNGSGAMHFARTGGSLQLPVVLPTGKILPLYLTFDIKALSTKYAQFGTAITDMTGKGPPLMTSEPASLPVTQWHTDRWVRWVRSITPRADGKIQIEQHYGEQQVGQFGVAESRLYTNPGGELFIELHGTDVLIDNVRLVYGPDAGAKIAREAEAGTVNK